MLHGTMRLRARTSMAIAAAVGLAMSEGVPPESGLPSVAARPHYLFQPEDQQVRTRSKCAPFIPTDSFGNRRNCWS